MKTIIQHIKENYKLVLGTLVVGLLLGWVFFHSSGTNGNKETGIHEEHSHAQAEPTAWTCSMHPQIKQDKPGLCPICAMDLIPLSSNSSGGEDADPNEIAMTESAAKLADVQTMVVKRGTPQKSIYLQGKVQADERNISELTARFGGRIEKLFINFTGQKVRKGQKMATIYSPGLVTAQRELLQALAVKESRPSLYAAARGKLKLWDLTEEQINAIEQKDEPQVYFDVLSPIAGTVTMRHVANGNYIKEGEPLFKVVDLTKVWVMFDAYESDLPWIKKGDAVHFTIQAMPGKEFQAKVSYIDPFLDPTTRIAKVRVDINNPDQILKPEMFTSGVLQSEIAGNANELLVPKSAILWTGKRSVVYTKVPGREAPTFIYRQVVLGAEAGTHYVIEKGLSEGEEIAVNGVFKIDAAAQLMGKASMMNPMETGEQQAVKVAGNCEMCKSRIEKAALSVEGVFSARWNANEQLLHLDYDAQKTSSDYIQKIVARSGHDTESFSAPDDTYNELPGCCIYERLGPTVKASKASEHAMVKVAGNCGMCKDRIETAALSVDGVTLANWNADKQMLHLNYDGNKTTSDAIQKVVAKAGHDTEKYRADNDTYSKLPGCCQFERLK